jgi:type II secretory ATPase GspE/PulE/Tfp pilus assembly ATPase PilB-like protein
MTCEAVRDELIAYAREELDDARKAAVEEHLVRCGGCTRELEDACRVMALTRLADDASVADLARDLIQAAIRAGASDLHLEMDTDGPRTRLRIDGVISPGPPIPRPQYEPLIARVKMMASMNVSEKRLPQDGRIAFSHEEKEYDLRVSTCPFFDGEGIVMRILNRSQVFLGLDRLGFSPEALAQLETAISHPDGLIVATGPTGSGKSTLLYRS